MAQALEDHSRKHIQRLDNSGNVIFQYYKNLHDIVVLDAKSIVGDLFLETGTIYYLDDIKRAKSRTT